MASLSSLSKRHKQMLIAAGALLLIVVMVVSRARKNSKQLLGTVTVGSIVDAVYGIGTVTAAKTFQLKLAVASTLRNLYVKEGDFVRAGAPLVYLEGVAAFRAPFAGTITSVPYKLGESVFPQVPLLTLTDLKDRYLVVTLEQQGAIRVEKGMSAVATFESLKGQQFNGNVRTIFSSDALFVVHIDVKELPDRVLPGMTADVAIQTSKRDGVKLVPVAALANGRVFKYALSGNTEVPVEVGTMDGSMAEIRSDALKAGDQVVLGTKN